MTKSDLDELKEIKHNLEKMIEESDNAALTPKEISIRAKELLEPINMLIERGQEHGRT